MTRAVPWPGFFAYPPDVDVRHGRGAVLWARLLQTTAARRVMDDSAPVVNNQNLADGTRRVPAAFRTENGCSGTEPGEACTEGKPAVYPKCRAM